MERGNVTLTASGQDTRIDEFRQACDCGACLIVVRGRQQGKRYELSAPSMRIGRESSSDILIDDPKVSRCQAIIRSSGGVVTLVDGGSKNGSYVNDRKVLGGASVLLNKEDMIKVGDTVLKYLPRGALETYYIGILEARAHIDHLTRVYNKQYILDAMETEFKRARALGTEFSLLFIDLDYFKWINDTFGHDSGDCVLVEVSAVLRGAVSANRGIFGRFGGEEFVALLPGHSRADALELAELTRASVERHPFTLEDRAIGMTTSIGVASMAADTSSVRELLKLADKAVYLAKHGGRNRVCDGSA